MHSTQVKTHTDGIWESMPKEIAIIKAFNRAILENNFTIVQQNNNNYGYPYVYQRKNQTLDCRFVDSVFLERPEAWNQSTAIVTDNIPLNPVHGQLILVVPEFWHIWSFNPVYENRIPTRAYNCFMNRPRGDRSRTFYELVRRGIISHGLVSFNVDTESYQQEYQRAQLTLYQPEHLHGLAMIPYNNLTGTLEQCIIDSRVSLILETYVSDDHIVFSEKLFRCLQMPRPWLLYCSPDSIEQLRKHGFDVLDDYVDHSYDAIGNHNDRLLLLLDQLEKFITVNYTEQDYTRFDQAAQHNKNLLKSFEQAWPNRVLDSLTRIQQL